MSINRKDIGPDLGKEHPPNYNDYLSDIRTWGEENANTIIRACATLGAITATTVLIFNLAYGPFAHHVVASDVSEHVEAMRASGTYSQEVANVPRPLREASVAFSVSAGKETEHGQCTGTVLEKIDSNDNLYTMITDRHCFENEDGESTIDDGSVLWMGHSPDGAVSERTEEGFFVEKYVPVEGTDIAFVVFSGGSETSYFFAPLGPEKLETFSPEEDLELNGFSYPFVSEGWPVPVSNLSTVGAELSEDSYSFPVESFPFSVASSGAGLTNKDDNIVALVRGFNYKFWDTQNGKIQMINPITDQVISVYKNLLSRFNSGKG